MTKYAIIAGFLLLAGCGKNIQTPESVRQAVVDDIRARAATTGLNPDAMDVTVSSVSFGDQQAHATVSFTPKGMPNAGGMAMDYTLDEKGGKWVVSSRHMAVTGNPHEGQGSVTPGAIPPSGELPPGHPPASAQQ